MAKKYYLYFLLLCLCFAQAGQISAQDYIDDAAVWVNIYLEKKISKHWDLHLNQQDRFNENVSKFGLAYADMGLTYHFNGNVKVMADYVFIQRRRIDDTYSTRHQSYVALILKKEIGRWSLMYRNMLQEQVKDVYSSEDGAVPVYYERNKLTVKYDINKYFTAYTAGELYYPLYQAKYRGFDRSRTFLGMFCNVNRRTSIELYFMYQHELNAFGPTNRDYIYGLGFEKKF